ncbi:MAG: hypothetical protein JO197_14180 [Acidobacteria bacterium]|nr:hypothetical protein [Acidobacteriota bacterium]MBV9478693.1 hypothetical protein [Acidobacteriota bacterium]
MDNREFAAAFEACTLAPFHHADHVRLAWIYLREAPLLDALHRFVTGLQRYAASRGASGLYHETITWAFLFLIHERMQRSSASDFAEFAEANPDLLRWKPSVLDRYYRAETLQSDLARRTFVLPDLGA